MSTRKRFPNSIYTRKVGVLAPFVFVVLILLIGGLLSSCGDDDKAVNSTSLVLNSDPLHLGDNANQAPLHGVEFVGSDNVTRLFSSATLSVQFMGEIDWPISSPTTTISGVDIGPVPFITGVEVLINGTKVGLDPSDFPTTPACISVSNEYICPFEFTVDVTAEVVQGTNEVIVRSLDGDDFVIKDVVIRLQ